MSDRLLGKVAIITGAAGGIGGATAHIFAREGASVAAIDLNLQAVQSLASQLAGQNGGRAQGFACDVSNEHQVEATVRATLDHFGRLDVIVNNAGVMTFKPLINLTAEDWREVLGVDLFGAAFFTREALRHMGEGGAIVNIASVHAIMTTSNVAPYAAAKAALLSLTRSAAIEGWSRHIRANAILPGAIDTPMLWNNPNVKCGAETLDPAQIGKPDDVAAAALFLASDQAKFVTGATLAVDGGRLVRL